MKLLSLLKSFFVECLKGLFVFCVTGVVLFDSAIVVYLVWKFIGFLLSLDNAEWSVVLLIFAHVVAIFGYVVLKCSNELSQVEKGMH